MVTGASGLIGSALCPVLEGAGHRVLRMVRAGKSTAAGTIAWDPAAGTIDAGGAGGCRCRRAPRRCGHRRPSLDRRPEAVDHRQPHAGHEAPRRDARRAGREARGARVGLGRRVLRKPRRRGAHRGRALRATTSSRDVCKEWEAATAPAADAGIRVVNIRTGIVLARHGGVLKRLLLPFRLGLGGRIGSGRQYMSWITLDDEVEAIVHVMTDDDARGRGEPHGAEPGHQRRVHRDARPRAAPADGAPDAARAVARGLRQRARAAPAARRAARCCRRASRRPATASATPSSSPRSKRCSAGAPRA